MPQLFHTTFESDRGTDCTKIAIGEHGTAILRDASTAVLESSTDLSEALDSAAAIVTRELLNDGDISGAADARHFLLAAADASVLHNGTPLSSTGIAALSRKDEIFVGGESGVRRFYYTDEVLPEPEAVPADLNEDSCCPRCRGSLHAKSPTAEGLAEEDDPTISRKPLIRCGGCGSLYHAHGCYTYEPTCLICLAPTAGHKLWTPEELD